MEFKGTKSDFIIVDSLDRVENEKGQTIASFCYGSHQENIANTQLFYKSKDMLKMLELILDKTQMGIGVGYDDLQDIKHLVNEAKTPTRKFF